MISFDMLVCVIVLFVFMYDVIECVMFLSIVCVILVWVVVIEMFDSSVCVFGFIFGMCRLVSVGMKVMLCVDCMVLVSVLICVGLLN